MVSVGRYDDSEKYSIGSQEYYGELQQLYISWLSGSVTLIEDETLNKMIVIEENDLTDDKKVHSLFENNTLYIQYAEANFYGNIDNTKKNLILKYNPVTYIDIHVTSGTIISDKISAETVNISFTSGDVEIKELQADNLDLTFTSGNVKIEELHANDLDITYTSGSVEIDQLYVNDADISYTSGSSDVSLNDCKKLVLDMTSGTSHLKIRDDIATKVKVDKTSGSFKSTKTATIIDDEYTFGPIGQEIKMIIEIDFTSGKVYIE